MRALRTLGEEEFLVVLTHPQAHKALAAESLRSIGQARQRAGSRRAMCLRRNLQIPSFKISLRAQACSAFVFKQCWRDTITITQRRAYVPADF
jgi:hypothetical protein